MKILLGGRQRAVNTQRPSREPFSLPLKAGAMFDKPRDGLVRHFYCQLGLAEALARATRLRMVLISIIWPGEPLRARDDCVELVVIRKTEAQPFDLTQQTGKGSRRRLPDPPTGSSICG
jgi:hypothetical protein